MVEKQHSINSQDNQSSFSEYFKSSLNESEAKTRNEISISVIHEKGIILHRTVKNLDRTYLSESQITNFQTNNILKNENEKEKERYTVRIKPFKFKNIRNENLRFKIEKKRLFRMLILIDILCVLIDLFCVTILYFDVKFNQ